MVKSDRYHLEYTNIHGCWVIYTYVKMKSIRERRESLSQKKIVWRHNKRDWKCVLVSAVVICISFPLYFSEKKYVQYIASCVLITFLEQENWQSYNKTVSFSENYIALLLVWSIPDYNSSMAADIKMLSLNTTDLKIVLYKHRPSFF
jgi:hypothetical protein